MLPLHAGSCFLRRAVAFFLALCLIFGAAGLEAATESNESASGICVRPRPAPDQAAYVYCRASAWLDALEQAVAWLPASAERRLWEMDLTSRSARLALAALLFPVGASTPDISASPEVRVFLDIRPEDNLASIWADPEKLLLEIAIIDEMRFTLAAMRAFWPDAHKEGDVSSGQTDLAEAINALWELASSSQGDALSELSLSSPAMIKAARNSSLPAMLLLAKARAALDAEMPQDAQALAAQAFEACENRLSEADANDKAWTMLSAWASYLRGLAHWRLNQDALARQDLEKAASLARAVGVHLPLLASITLASAELLRHRGFTSQMCKELEEACALGSCGDLAAARRKGMCGARDEKP